MFRTRVQPGKSTRPTRDDVARKANISGATVSRVLSGRTDLPISPEARARVLEAAASLGYRPNQMARALMTGRTGLVGFWMSLHYSRYRSQVLDKMRAQLGQTELAMAVTDVDEEYSWDHSFDRALRVPVEGIIAFDAEHSVDAFAKERDRIAPRIPFVSMGAYWAESKSYVGVDLRSGIDAAMDHLLSSGRRRIIFMAPWDSGLLTKGPRYEAYREKMEDSGLIPSTVPTETVAIASVREALRPIVAASTAPDAILCMNDDLAISAVFGLEQLGILAGKDIAIVGFDGIEETEQCSIPITTVRQPIEQMCSLAFSCLRAQMEDPTGPLQQTILKPDLVIRASSSG